jgi:hypothetical protein
MDQTLSPSKSMDSNKTLYFTDGTDTYHLTGEIYDYFYSGGYEPHSVNTCTDILEKLQFVNEIWLQSSSGEFFEKDLPDEIIEQLTEEFESMEESEMSHWELLSYKSLSAKKFANCKGEVREETNQLILTAGKLKLFVPEPFNGLYDAASNEDLSGSSILELKKMKRFRFEIPDEDDDTQWLFMNTDQLKSSHATLDEIIKKVIKIFSKNGIKMKNCNDLVTFILS